MLPYSAMAAMDYAAYQQRELSPVSGAPMGMSVGGSSSFTHSWLVPTQDLCAVPYKHLSNQQQNAAMQSNQQNIEPGHVQIIQIRFYNFKLLLFILKLKF